MSTDIQVRISQEINVVIEELQLKILKETNNKPSKKDLVENAIKDYQDQEKWKKDFNNSDGFAGYTLDQLHAAWYDHSMNDMLQEIQDWYIQNGIDDQPRYLREQKEKQAAMT